MMDQPPKDEAPIQTETQEKLGLIWLADLHKKMEAIRALRLRLVREAEEMSDDEAMELVLNIDANLDMLIETEIRPLSENRGEWPSLQAAIEVALEEKGCDDLDPRDPMFFTLYAQYVDVILCEVEKCLELYGVKASPYPISPDVVGIAWEQIEEEARRFAMEQIVLKQKIIEAREVGQEEKSADG